MVSGESLPGGAFMTDWSEGAFAALRRHEVRQVAYVPDAGLSRLLERCAGEPSMTTVVLTTEEEGVGLLVGAWLGGQRGALLMQSSGVGNCVNLFGLPRLCGCPLLSIVTMRGEPGEFNPWQEPMGRNTQAVLELCGATVARVEAPDAAEQAIDAAARRAFEQRASAAVLIAQRTIGIKTFEVEEAAP